MAVPWPTDVGEPPRDVLSDRAPRPKNVVVTRLDAGSFKVSWDAAIAPAQPFGANGQYLYSGTWQVRITPVNLAGDSGDTDFAARCLSLSRVVAAPSSPGTLIITDSHIGNCYVIVVGVSPISGRLGVPSQPQLLDNNVGLIHGPGGNVTQYDVGVDVAFGGTLLLYQWRAPAAPDFGGFGGVHLHITGYQGSVELRELGSFIPYGFDLEPARLIRGSMVVTADVNPCTVYFVSVGRDGSRTNDPVGISPFEVVVGGLSV